MLPDKHNIPGQLLVQRGAAGEDPNWRGGPRAKKPLAENNRAGKARAPAELCSTRFLIVISFLVFRFPSSLSTFGVYLTYTVRCEHSIKHSRIL